MLNANLLAKSDFLTGAFPAEYANAIGSVFDLRLRKGNDEKREFLGQMTFNGLKLGAEGPFSKRASPRRVKSSYLVNYRYSLFGLLKNVGYQIAGTSEYQDGLFKSDFAVGKRGHLSFWAMSGQSRITFLGKDIKADKPGIQPGTIHFYIKHFLIRNGYEMGGLVFLTLPRHLPSYEPPCCR